MFKLLAYAKHRFFFSTYNYTSNCIYCSINNIYCYYFYIFFFFFSTTVLAQNKDKNKCLEAAFDVAVNRHNVRDNTFSAFPYAGITLSSGGNISYSTIKHKHTFSGYYTSGYLSPQFKHLENIQFSYYNFDYLFLYKPQQASHAMVSYKIGPGIQVFNYKRFYNEFINNNNTQDFVTSLHAVVELLLQPKGKFSGFSIQNNLQLPIVSAILQPVYGADAWAVPNKDEEKQLAYFMRNLQFITCPSFFSIKNKLLINKNIAKKHTVSFFYTIDYFSIKHARNVQQHNHQLGFQYKYVLK